MKWIPFISITVLCAGLFIGAEAMSHENGGAIPVDEKERIEFSMLKTLIATRAADMESMKEDKALLIAVGCPAIAILASYIDSTAQEQHLWVMDRAKKFLGYQPFDVSEELPNDYDFTSAMETILGHSQDCRHQVLEKTELPSALAAAMSSSTDHQDARMILARWKRQGDRFPLGALGNGKYYGYLEEPSSIPLLIEMLKGSEDRAEYAAKTLILLTGQDLDKLTLEKGLPPFVSRAPYLLIDLSYVKDRVQLYQSWLAWWSQVETKIHWDSEEPNPWQEGMFMGQPFRPKKGKFVW